MQMLLRWLTRHDKKNKHTEDAVLYQRHCIGSCPEGLALDLPQRNWCWREVRLNAMSLSQRLRTSRTWITCVQGPNFDMLFALPEACVDVVKLQFSVVVNWTPWRGMRKHPNVVHHKRRLEEGLECFVMPNGKAVREIPFRTPSQKFARERLT